MIPDRKQEAIVVEV